MAYLDKDGYTETSSNYSGDNEKNCGDNSGGIENNREDNTKQSGMDFLVEQLDTEPKDIYDPDA